MILYSRKLILPSKKSGGGFKNNTYILGLLHNYSSSNRVEICFTEDLVNIERYVLTTSDSWGGGKTLWVPHFAYFNNKIVMQLAGYYNGGSFTSRLYYFTKEDIVNGGNLDTLPYINNALYHKVVDGNLVFCTLKGQGTLINPYLNYIPAGQEISQSNVVTVNLSAYLGTGFYSAAYGNGVFLAGGYINSGRSMPRFVYASNINFTDAVSSNFSSQSSTGEYITFVNGRFYTFGSTYCFSGTSPTSMQVYSSNSNDYIGGPVLYGNGYYYSYTTSSYPSSYEAWYSTNGTSFTGVARSSNWVDTNRRSMIFDGNQFVIFTSFYGTAKLYTQRTPVEAKVLKWQPDKVYNNQYASITFVPKGSVSVEGY